MTHSPSGVRTHLTSTDSGSPSMVLSVAVINFNSLAALQKNKRWATELLRFWSDEFDILSLLATPPVSQAVRQQHYSLVEACRSDQNSDRRIQEVSLVIRQRSRAINIDKQKHHEKVVRCHIMSTFHGWMIWWQFAVSIGTDNLVCTKMAACISSSTSLRGCFCGRAGPTYLGIRARLIRAP